MKALAALALAAVGAASGAAASASDLDGCWKMGDARTERQSGNVSTARADCIRAYRGTWLVTSCRGGKDIGVYALTDMSVATYSFEQVGRHVDGKASVPEASSPRAAAFRVAGNTLHMVLGRGPGTAPDPVLRVQQTLTRLPAAECAALGKFLGAVPASATDAKAATDNPVQPASG